MDRIHYRPALDGLRAISVMAILVFHLNPEWLPGGFVGVDVFFVVSGFLITSIIVSGVDLGTFSLWRFYQRRIARILPAFMAMALVTLSAAYLIYSPQDLALAGAYLAASVLSLTNVKLMFQGSYFSLSPDAHPFMHCWSLSLEEQFYLLFPIALVIFRGGVRRFLLPVLIIAGLTSFALCLFLTTERPVWAFYLLPTRGWELLAGAALAVAAGRSRSRGGRRTFTRESVRRATEQVLGSVGLGLILWSFVIVDEDHFPGYQAVLPVLGTVLLIACTGPETKGPVAGLLTWAPMVGMGKLSYSLYLWHWPVYSLIDYRLLEISEASRVVLKILLTLLLALTSYVWVERPMRGSLARPVSPRISYVFLAACLALIVPLGMWIQNRNYVNAKNGGTGRLVFNPYGRTGTLMLMGDSHGSMYGKAIREYAEEYDFRLVVASCAALDALPPPDEGAPSLWSDAIGVVEEERPDVVLLACAWSAYLDKGGERLSRAVQALSVNSKAVVLVTQPPELPPGATRAAMRLGARPPFAEEAATRELRERANAQVLGAAGGSVFVIDVAELVESGNAVPFFDDKGRQLYHDKSHLSHFGAVRILPELDRIVQRRLSQFQP